MRDNVGLEIHDIPICRHRLARRALIAFVSSSSVQVCSTFSGFVHIHFGISGLEIIFGRSPVKMTGQIHFSLSYLVSDRTNIYTYFFFYKVHSAIRCIPNFATQVFKLKNITKERGHRAHPELKKNFSQVYFSHNLIHLQSS